MVKFTEDLTTFSNNGDTDVNSLRGGTPTLHLTTRGNTRATDFAVSVAIHSK